MTASPAQATSDAHNRQELQSLTEVASKSAQLDVVQAELEGFRAQLEANYLSLKKASAVSRQAIERAEQSELLSRRSEPEEEARRRRRLDKEGLSQKASSLTEDLLNISQMMAAQVAVSEQSLNSLVSSSAVVTETQEEFKSMGSLLVQSRNLLSKYGRREITDRVLIFLALAFFFACCLYVLLKRLF